MTVLLLTLAAMHWAVRRQIAVVTVVGESMQPAYRTGDRVLMRRARLSEVRSGQVVVIEQPAAGGAWVTPWPRWPGSSREWMIKRVAALPGDTLPELPPSKPELPPSRLAAGSVVPPGKLFVLGDNPAASLDSRQFGYCPADRLLGVVLRPSHSTRRSARQESAPPRAMLRTAAGQTARRQHPASSR